MAKIRHRESRHRPAPPATTEQQIRTRAYELYRARNGEPGHDVDDWLRAEEEILTNAAPSGDGRR
jgi:hypothetical protein